jgi:NAD(P)H-quinone oxidoreductase subunit 5
MTLDNSSLLLLAAPAAMLIVSLASTRHAGLCPLTVERLGVGAGAFSLYIAAIGVALVINHGPMVSEFLGSQALGFSVQLHPMSAVLLLAVALLGFQFIRLSRRMGGAPRRRVFLGRLSATLAAVQLVVLTGNMALLVLAAMLAGLTLHGLSGYYRERRGALQLTLQRQLDATGGI